MPFDALDPAATHDLTTGRGRLAYLADVVLERVRREELPFKLHFWFFEPNRAEDCGTAACACGWATRDPLLREQGLTHVRNDEPSFQDREGFEAIEEFFGLTEDESSSFFLLSSYPDLHLTTAAQVQSRIREHLAGG